MHPDLIDKNPTIGYTASIVKIRVLANEPGMGDLRCASVLPSKLTERNTSISNFIQKILLGKSDLFAKLQNNIHYYQTKISEFIKEHRTIKLLHLLRNYSSFVIVVSSALLVAATNFASGKSPDSFMFGYWNNNDNSNQVANRMTGQGRKSDLAFVSLPKTSTAIDPNLKPEDELSIIQGQSLAASYGAPLKDPEEDGGVKMYEVQQGDTLGAIAAKYKITTNTILWANDIENVDSIMPGDKLFILPVAGLTHTVKSGDTVDSIAEKYKADKEKIIAFNDLPADGKVETGKEIIIPDGKKDTPAPAATTPDSTGIARRQYATTTGGTPTVSGWKTLEGKAGTGHSFPYGYCTWYVAKRRYVPWGGNAGTWLYHAKAAGYKTGKTPTVGSIMVSSESWWGHVAIVESVSADSFTVSEMNYKGWAKKSSRVVSKSNRVIKGFIY